VSLSFSWLPDFLILPFRLRAKRRRTRSSPCVSSFPDGLRQRSCVGYVVVGTPGRVLDHIDRATLRRLRLPIGLAVAALVVAVIGANIQWIMLARERDALTAQMTELLLNAFPKTTVVLDPASQMTTQLQHLRVAAGELSPDDFLSLAARLDHALGAVPVNGIAALDYHDRRLDVTFKPDVKPDPAFGQRLAQNGLAGEIDTNTGKWVIRNGSGQ